MSEQSEMQFVQVDQVVIFCEDHRSELNSYPTKAKKLNYLYEQIKGFSPDVVLKGFARWLKGAASA